MFFTHFYASPVLTVHILNIIYLPVVNSKNIYYRLVFVFSLSVRCLLVKQSSSLFYIIKLLILEGGYVFYMIWLKMFVHHRYKDISL